MATLELPAGVGMVVSPQPARNAMLPAHTNKSARSNEAPGRFFRQHSSDTKGTSEARAMPEPGRPLLNGRSAPMVEVVWIVTVLIAAAVGDTLS